MQFLFLVPNATSTKTRFSHLLQNLNENLKPLSANPTKWSNTIKQFVIDHFVGLAHKRLK